MTLYVETNLIVGVATGRIPDLDLLLSRAGAGLTLAVPGVCFMEAMVWMEGESRRRLEFDRLLGEQESQLRRDVRSAHARSLRSHIAQARSENRALLLSVESRLFTAIAALSARAEILAVDAATLERSRSQPVLDELTDNLIVHCVLRHAAGHPDEPKLFVSGNTRDLGRVDVRKALGDHGVDHVFSEVANVLGWLDARPGT